MDNEIVYSRCKRCNRILKTEQAKERGYGDYCWRMYQKTVKNSKNRYVLTEYLFPKK